MKLRRREARLRAESEIWYPGVVPGIWHDAARLTEMVVRRCRRSGRCRPLADAHFEFQGRSPRGVTYTRRWTDSADPPFPFGMRAH